MKTLSLLMLVLCVLLPTSLTEAAAQPQAGKISWMSAATVALGKMRGYHTFAEKESVPPQEKAGYDFVAGCQTIVGDIEEVIVVVEFGRWMHIRTRAASSSRFPNGDQFLHH